VPNLRGAEPVTAYAALSRLRIAAALRRRGFARSVASTAGFNLAATAVGGLGGIIIARVLGPTVRGEYAAVTAWMGVLQLVGGMGQPAAVVYYVAREPPRARDYVATSRTMMLATGFVALVVGVLLAPVLGHGLPALTAGYRIAFGALIVAFVGGSFTASLQARDLHRWNVVRVIQPVLGLIAIVVLWRLRRLTLDGVMVVIAAAMLLQLVWPATLNADLDQLVLSQTVSAADLGRYAVAVSISLLPMPLVFAIGNVAMPRLAATREVTGATRQLQRLSVLASAGLAVAVLVPLAAVSYWLVPLVFGAAYRGAVPLLWVLTPGSVFLACGQVTGDLLRGRRHPAVVAWAEGIAAILTVALLLALLPLVGVYGAAIASTVSYGVALAIMLRRLSRLPRHAAEGAPKTASPETAMAPRHGEARVSPFRRAAMTMTDLRIRLRAGHRGR